MSTHRLIWILSSTTHAVMVTRLLEPRHGPVKMMGSGLIQVPSVKRFVVYHPKYRKTRPLFTQETIDQRPTHLKLVPQFSIDVPLVILFADKVFEPANWMGAGLEVLLIVPVSTFSL